MAENLVIFQGEKKKKKQLFALQALAKLWIKTRMAFGLPPPPQDAL